MRLLRLDLLAFGPFTAAALDFSAPGLHVVHGPNEAGKSTALRAVAAALYGIPARSDDDHVHPYNKMRVGLTVADAAGNQLAFVRKKGNKDTLLTRGADGAETPLPQAALDPFLNGVTAETFARQYGIDRAELSDRSGELLTGGGAVGQLLFAAAGGLQSVRAVKDQLAEEAGKLFKRGGSRPEVNKSLDALKALRDRGRGQSLTPATFEAATRRLAELRADRDRLKEQRRLARAAQHRADRLTAARGIAARLAADQARLDTLSADAETDAALLGAADRIGALTEHAAVVRRAAAERPGFLRDAAAEDRAARTALADLRPAGGGCGDGPDAAWTPPDPSAPQRARIRRAAERHAGLLGVLEGAAKTERAAADRAARFAAARDRHAALGCEAAAALGEAVEQAAARRDAPARLDALAGTIGEAEDTLAAARAALRGLAGDRFADDGCVDEGSADEGGADGGGGLDAFRAPNRETLARCERDRADAAAALAQASDARDAAAKALARVERDAAALAAAGAVPSEADLADRRAEREAAWARVRGVVLGDAPASDPAGLADDYETRRDAADAAADALRSEADRVAQAAGLRADAARLSAELEDADAALAAARERVAARAAEWAAEWPDLAGEPLPPAEMRPWLEDLAAARAARRERNARRREAEALRSAADAAAAALAAELHALNRLAEHADDRAAPPPATAADLPDLLVRGRKAVRRLAENAGRHDEAVASFEEAERDRRLAAADRQAAAAALAEWAADWTAAVAPLGLTDADAEQEQEGADPPEPAAALAFLTTWEAAREHRLAAERFREQIAQIDADAEAFAAACTSAAADLAPDLAPEPCADLPADPAGRSPGEVCAALADRVAAARDRAAERAALPPRIAAARAELDAQRGGEEPAAFLEAARAADPDALAADAAAAAEEAEALDAAHDRAVAAVTEAETELAALDTRGAAAALEQEAQDLLAEVDADAERYARLRLAELLLAKAADRFRQRRQGPVLDRAGELFRTLTGGAYTGLAVAFGEGDDPTLKGVRTQPVGVQPDGAPPDEPPVHVAPPAMSHATRDQLYLALRLAGLTATAAERPVPPLIADDVLERFDEARTACALRALAEVSETVQVILFTHHRLVADLARAALPGRATVHHLPGPAGTVPDAVPAPVPDAPPAQSAPPAVKRAERRREKTAAGQRALL